MAVCAQGATYQVRSRADKRQRLSILTDVSAYFSPAEMSAVMDPRAAVRSPANSRCLARPGWYLSCRANAHEPCLAPATSPSNCRQVYAAGPYSRAEDDRRAARRHPLLWHPTHAGLPAPLYWRGPA